jgi:hypothetical protein
MLAIEAIKFNHNIGAATNDALNIRQNVTQFISVPEWRRFISVNPEDSRAAYAVGPTLSKPITIEVSLSSTDSSVAFVEVRVERHVRALVFQTSSGTGSTGSDRTIRGTISQRRATGSTLYSTYQPHPGCRRRTIQATRSCRGPKCSIMHAVGQRAQRQQTWRRRW